MSALMVNEMDVLRDTMIQESTLTSLVGAGDSARIIWEYMNEEGEDVLPYIKCIYMSGGRANDAKESNDSDSMWKIVAVTNDQAQARLLLNALDNALTDVDPVVTNTPDVTDYTPIEEIMPIFDSYKVGNVPMFEAGGLYRLRLIIN